MPELTLKCGILSSRISLQRSLRAHRLRLSDGFVPIYHSRHKRVASYHGPLGTCTIILGLRLQAEGECKADDEREQTFPSSQRNAIVIRDLLKQQQFESTKRASETAALSANESDRGVSSHATGISPWQIYPPPSVRRTRGDS